MFTPPDREIFGRSCAAGNIRLVSCYYDRDYSERIVGSLVDLSQSQLLSCLSLRSPLLPHLLGRLMRETLCPGFRERRAPLKRLVTQSWSRQRMLC